MDAEKGKGEGIYSGALSRALFFIGIKERSKREVVEYLLRKGYSQEDAGEVACYLERKGIIDDERLAEAIVIRAPLRGIGRARAKSELLSRGIERDMASSAVEEFYPENEIDIALRAVSSYWDRKSGQEDVKERRLAQWLARRGFSPATIMRVVERLREESLADSTP